MLKIICGEDTIASRSFLTQLQQNYKNEGYYIEKIPPNQIEEVIKGKGAEILLFNEKKAYFVENLTTFTARKKDKTFLKLLSELIEDKTIEVIDWEEKPARDIKLKTTDVKEFKPSQTIFQVQEACYPGNLQGFISSLRKVLDAQEEGFVFFMLSRHMRTILLAKTGSLPSNTPPWMKGKFQLQADKWKQESLLAFYEGLARLDSSLKTSSNIYGIGKSIELLACYFLK